MKARLCLTVLSALLFLGLPKLRALGTAFTYQGRLLESGAAGTGSYDFEFSLHTLPTGGTLTAGPITLQDVPVTNGLFTVQLDFGAGAFGPDARWLAMGVRNGTDNTSPFFALPTRQALTAVPQAQFALAAATVVDGAITAGKIASGQVVKSLNGLKDDVVLEAGSNVTLTPNGNRLQIAATGGGSQTPAQIISAVLANDGGGSGLNADLIDGIDSANLARKTEVQDRVFKDGDTMTGTLTLQPPNTAQALVVDASVASATQSALEVRNTGNGRLATFGSASNEKLWIDKDGNLTANNLPGLNFAQADVYGAPAGGLLHITTSEGERTVDEITVRVPAPGFLFVVASSRVEFDGTGPGSTSLRFQLYDATQAEPLQLSEQWLEERTNNRFTQSVCVPWVLPVTGSGDVKLRTTAIGSDQSLADVPFLFWGHGLTAIYLPMRYASPQP